MIPSGLSPGREISYSSFVSSLRKENKLAPKTATAVFQLRSRKRRFLSCTSPARRHFSKNQLLRMGLRFWQDRCTIIPIKMNFSTLRIWLSATTHCTRVSMECTARTL